jgi:hypothetical protein
MKHLFSLFFFSSFFFFNSFSQKIIYVNESANGLNNGSSWKNAYQNLFDALSNTISSKEIWVAQGVYYSTINNARDSSFKIRNGVAIYGGFIGNETKRNQRDWTINKTILSGDIGIKNDTTDNSYNIVELTDVDSTTILDGLIITFGYAVKDTTYVGHKAKNGGGIRINALTKNCTPKIINCKIINNSANRDGGGVWINRNLSFITHPVFINCEIGNNHASRGGAFFINGNFSLKKDFFLYNSIINNNFSLDGGAINLTLHGGFFGITKCKFEENKNEGGDMFYGLMTKENVIIMVDSTSFNKNSNGKLGIFSLKEGDFILANSIFNNNKNDINQEIALVEVISLGGKKLSITIKNCIFDDNKFGRILELNSNTAIINKVRFLKNNAIEAISCRVGNLLINNSAFLDNSNYKLRILSNSVMNISNSIFKITSDSIKNRGGLDIETKNGLLSNNIFYTESNFFPLIALNDGKLTVTNNLFNKFDKNDITKVFSFLSKDSIKINRILVSDPQFKDVANHDFRLLPCSPAINAGTLDMPSEVKALLQNDLDGKARVVSDSIDIGAYEYRDMSASVVASSIKCGGDLGAMKVSATGACMPLKINWLRSDGKQDTTTKNLAAGSYQVRVKDANNSYIDLKVQLIEQGSVVAFSAEVRNPTSALNDGSVVLYNVSGGTSPYTYAWSNGATTLKIENLTAAYYTVTVTDKNGCATIRKFKVGNPIATNDIFLSEATIYPNPVEDKLYIRQIDNELDNIKISIYSLQGALLLSSDYSKNGLDVSFLPKGIYFLQCSNGGQSRAMKMLKN